MEINCSFQRLVGGQCSHDKRSRLGEKGALILPLLSCRKIISGHVQSVGVTDVETEMELILARASIFTTPSDISNMIICPAQSLLLGHRLEERFSAMPRSRSVIEPCQREIAQT